MCLKFEEFLGKLFCSNEKSKVYFFLTVSSLFSAKATNEYELARKKVATFINASDSSEIVFTRNATEAINLVAYSWGLSNLNAEDEVCFLWLNILSFL